MNSNGHRDGNGHAAARDEHIARVRQAIAEGAYDVDARLIASSMLQMLGRVRELEAQFVAEIDAIPVPVSDRPPAGGRSRGAGRSARSDQAA
jgi:hypothetical protein